MGSSHSKHNGVNVVPALYLDILVSGYLNDFRNNKLLSLKTIIIGYCVLMKSKYFTLSISKSPHSELGSPSKVENLRLLSFKSDSRYFINKNKCPKCYCFNRKTLQFNASYTVTHPPITKTEPMQIPQYVDPVSEEKEQLEDNNNDEHQDDKKEEPIQQIQSIIQPKTQQKETKEKHDPEIDIIEYISSKIEEINDSQLTIHKDEITQYLQNNSIDYTRLNVIGKKQFTKDIKKYCNDNKMNRGMKKLWVAITNYNIINNTHTVSTKNNNILDTVQPKYIDSMNDCVIISDIINIINNANDDQINKNKDGIISYINHNEIDYLKLQNIDKKK
eukprot:507502_1